jgi:zinc/manganese transport system permease protein
VTDVVQVLGLPLLTCLAIAAILGYLGMHVVMREIIFVDIAMAQIASVGAIAAHVAFGAHGDSVVSYVSAFGSTLLAAGFYSFVRRKLNQIPLEAVIGVSYAVATAATLFMLGVAPGGHVHVQQMLAGSILWTTRSDLQLCVLGFSLVGFCFLLVRKQIRMISEDYEGSLKAGMNVLWWDFLFYALMGIVITLAVRIAGVVVVFGFLIIPATLSALLASGWAVRWSLAWGSGAAASILGLSFSYHFDFSVGPSVTMFLGLGLVLVAAFNSCRKRLSLGPLP